MNKLSTERYTKVEDGLLIKNITTEDDGIYQCSANVENDGRFDFKTIKVEVHGEEIILFYFHFTSWAAVTNYY